jgi:hypothetical protein
MTKQVYYEKSPDGMQRDKDAMDAAREAVKGRGDGRISIADVSLHNPWPQPQAALHKTIPEPRRPISASRSQPRAPAASLARGPAPRSEVQHARRHHLLTPAPLAQADLIIKTLLDGQGVTAIEFSTAFLILRDFHFTPEAQTHFIAALAVAPPTHTVQHHPMS